MSEAHSNTMVVDHTNYSVFVAFLRYIYSGELVAEDDILWDLLIVANRCVIKSQRRFLQYFYLHNPPFRKLATLRWLIRLFRYGTAYLEELLINTIGMGIDDNNCCDLWNHAEEFNFRKLQNMVQSSPPYV